MAKSQPSRWVLGGAALGVLAAGRGGGGGECGASPGFSSGAGGELWGPPEGSPLWEADWNPARRGAEVLGEPCAGGRGTKEAGRPPPAGLGAPRRPRGAPQVVLGALGRGEKGEEEEEGAVLPLGCPPRLPSQTWGQEAPAAWSSASQGPAAGKGWGKEWAPASACVSSYLLFTIHCSGR